MEHDANAHGHTPAEQPTATRTVRWRRRILLPVAAGLAGLAMAGLALVLALAFAAFVAALVALALVGAVVTWALRTFVRRKRGETPAQEQESEHVIEGEVVRRDDR